MKQPNDYISKQTDEDIIEDAVNAFFASIQTELDPKEKMDLGGWASMAYDGHPDVDELHAIARRVLDAHRQGIKQADNA